MTLDFINDTVYLTLEEEVFKGGYSTIDLNQLTNREIDEVIQLFNGYGFWGKLAKKSYQEKENFIIRDCDRTFRLLLLEILKVPIFWVLSSLSDIKS